MFSSTPDLSLVLIGHGRRGRCPRRRPRRGRQVDLAVRRQDPDRLGAAGRGGQIRGQGRGHRGHDGAQHARTPSSAPTRNYGDFLLELEFKVDPQLNSGVQIRGQSRPDYQDGRVHGYQVEIDPDVEARPAVDRGPVRRGPPRLAGRPQRATSRPARRSSRSAWNHMRVEAIGDSIKTWINDVPAADLVDAKDLEGFIALQVHQVGKREEPLTVAWRKIRIQELGQPGLAAAVGRQDAASGLRAAGGGSWAVEGNLPGGQEPARARRGTACCSSRSRSGDFTARAEVRLTGGNAGLYLRAQPADDPPAGASGLQVDLDAEGGGRPVRDRGPRLDRARPGEQADEKARDKLNKSWKKGDWNSVTVVARDRRVGGARQRPAGRRATSCARGREQGRAGARAGRRAGRAARGAAAGGAVRRRSRRRCRGTPSAGASGPRARRPTRPRRPGFEYVELALQDVLDLPEDEFGKAVERFRALGIPALTGYNLIPAELKLVGPEADVAKQDEHLARALPRVARLGVKYVIFGSGPSRRIPDGMARARPPGRIWWPSASGWPGRPGRTGWRCWCSPCAAPTPTWSPRSARRSTWSRRCGSRTSS